MEIINHQRRRTNIKAPSGYEVDHIIPYCLGGSDSKQNLQFIKIREHHHKTGRDIRIINSFKKKGWIECVTRYSIELIKPKSFLKEQYLIEYNKLLEVKDT